MWTAKLVYRHEGSLVIKYATKYNLTILGFPMNTYIEKGVAHLTAGHLALGDESDKQKYYRDIKKEKRLTHCEIYGDLVIYSLSAPLKETHMQVYLSPEIMFLKPITIKPDGWEYMEVASWDKKHLTDFLKKANKWLEIKSQSIKKEKITDVYIPHLMPKITAKQKQAILLAYRNGYYTYPKQTNIERLAKLMKTSSSTFQEHLRKAEEKLMPFILENIAIR
jgi:predicted DNA binding protein